MKECSIIAMRQDDTSIICSWLEDDGSTICKVGEFLNQYQTSEDVERLFTLQKSENGNQAWWKFESETYIFDLYPVQHCYFFEWDYNWYYIFSGPGGLLFKIPLLLIKNNTDKITESDYLHMVQRNVLIALLNRSLKDPIMRLYLVVYVGEYEDLLNEIKESCNSVELELIYQKLKRIYAQYGRWIVINSDLEYKKIHHFCAVDLDTCEHCETCFYCLRKDDFEKLKERFDQLSLSGELNDP